MRNKFNTDRTICSALKQSDAEGLHQAFSASSQVTKYLTWQPHKSLADTQRYVKDTLVKVSKGNCIAITVREKVSGIIIGLQTFIVSGSTLQSGSCLDPDYWGLGYFTEVLGKCIDEAFLDSKYTLVFAHAHVHNYSSQRLMYKLGFVYTSVKEHDFEYPAFPGEKQWIYHFVKFNPLHANYSKNIRKYV